MNPLRRALGAQTGEQQVPRCSQLPGGSPHVAPKGGGRMEGSS